MGLLLLYLVPLFKTLPSNNAVWEELLAEGIHILKINKEAQMSAQEAMPYASVCWAAKILDVAAREQSRHESLLASGVVEALIWTVAHDCVWLGYKLAAYAAGPMVALIGRNEGGLTLTGEAINVILDALHNYFNYESTVSVQ